MMRLAKKLLTATLSFGVVLMIPFSAHAEEAEANPNARTVPHYTYSGEAGETGEGEKGDIWDGEHYYLADGTYGFCDGYSVVPYGIRTSLFYCVMNEDGTKDFVSRKLEYPVYIGFDGRCDFEKSKQYEKCDGNQISLINATLTYKWQEPKLQYEIFITPNGYDLIRYKLRVYNHAVSEGKSEDEAWDEAQNKWSEEINKIEDGEFYLLRGSKEDFDSFMVSVYGDWILDPYWEYGLLD